MTVNSDGEMQFKEGQNVNIALHDQKAGDILKMVFEGKMLGDSSKLLKKDDPAKTRGTRAADDMELVSGAEYEVLEAGDIVLTVAAKEAPVTLKSIGVNASGATGIESIRQNDNMQSDNWYNLDGSLLKGKPNRRGMYIHKGQKLVIK
jgi:transcriptional regulator of nitric oxide reductase